jgi:hypothetical protein
LLSLQKSDRRRNDLVALSSSLTPTEIHDVLHWYTLGGPRAGAAFVR